MKPRLREGSASSPQPARHEGDVADATDPSRTSREGNRIPVWLGQRPGRTAWGVPAGSRCRVSFCRDQNALNQFPVKHPPASFLPLTRNRSPRQQAHRSRPSNPPFTRLRCGGDRTRPILFRLGTDSCCPRPQIGAMGTGRCSETTCSAPLHSCLTGMSAL